MSKFNEDKIIKQLFNLNYEKQMTIKKLETKIKTTSYHIKYMRKDLRTLKSKYTMLNKYVDKYDDCINKMVSVFKLDKEIVDELKNDCGILNDNFILVIKEKPFREKVTVQLKNFFDVK